MRPTERPLPRQRSRAGFTAIELMVVVSIIILLVAMSVPSIYPAIRKGRVHDATNAILRVASQARQLARSRPMPANTSAQPLLFYGIAIVVPATGSAYATLTYDNSNPCGSVTGQVGRLADNSTTSYMSLQTFNANVMPFTSMITAGGPGVKAVYGLQPRSSKIGWYYQYRTGFIIQNASAPTSTNYTQIGNIGTPAVPANTTTGTPAVQAYTPSVFGVCSLDQLYVSAMSFYSIGLANAQDLF